MKDKILSALKNSDNYISGEILSRSLGITRSAVWKNIRQLRQEGYIIDSVTNKGYRLQKDCNMIDTDKVMKDLHCDNIGKKLIILKSTDSTNNEIKKIAALGEESGTVVTAETQTSGRGRFGRQWSSDKGGLYFSILLRTDLPPSNIAAITLAAGYAVCLAVREYTGLDARIKWPNDIIVENRKICGILTEIAAQSDSIDYIIIGIGININNTEFPDEIKHKASSIHLETNKNSDKSDFFRTVLIYLDKVISSFLISISIDDMSSFKRICATIGREVSVKRGENVLKGIARDITPFGELVIETEDSQKITISSGEVTVQGIY